ncbi:MAG: ATP-binding cassette domain-containing protein [Actinobacteria bacterium]|nr:ATP-binding cassette domain-containing protein [Actinomycetota bacterium]
MTTVALRVRGVHKRFAGHRVLQGVDLDVRHGEIVALVGENGAGKSTLVSCVAGALSADLGDVHIGDPPPAGPEPPGAPLTPELAVVWQDLALCDNLSAVANLFLGKERRSGALLDEAAMAADGRALFERLRISIPTPLLPVALLSGGQRQLVALARAVLHRPSVLILDEPTAALGVAESRVVERVIRQLRDSGTAVLLVSHRLDQVFGLADRIAVLRDGRVVADVSPLEVHPEDVVALMSGVEADSTARRQLRRLRSLVDQLAEVEPSASLPLIVSAMAEAVGVQQLCVHLVDTDGADDAAPKLRCSATVGLPDALLEALELLPTGASGGPPGIAAATGEAVVVEDCRRDSRWAPVRARRGPAPRSTWSVPIIGSLGVLGTISGFADAVGRPQADQLELVSLYASHAAAAIDREQLLADATRRNRVLETLRGVLDTMAGPGAARGGIAVVLLALCRGLGADVIALHGADGRTSAYPATDLGSAAMAVAGARQEAAADAVLSASGRVDRARLVGADVLAVPIVAPEGRVVVSAWWADSERLSNDALDLLDDAARSLRLALERETLEQATAEAESLRRSHRLQREFLSRLNHELRTPLTAIQGYASTLQQQDVSWDAWSQERFLHSIASESARMGRLVGDLLDFGAIDSGVLRLVPDWCDLGLVLEAARACVSEAAPGVIRLSGEGGAVPPVWADHDRLEQVFVNLLENAARHASGLTRVDVSARVDDGASTVTVRVRDDGPGVAVETAERMFLPHERGPADGPGAGLGLPIARGIVEAHGGRIRFEPSETGACVAVTLPIEPPGGVPDPAEAGAGLGAEAGSDTVDAGRPA